MNFGKIAQRFFVYFALATAAFAQTGSILFRLPGSGSGQTSLVAYPAYSSNLTPILNTAGPINATQVIPVPRNGRHYVVSDTGVQLLDVSNGSFTAINGIVGTVNRARITPDGRYLMVMGDTFYIVDTTTNSVLATNTGAAGQLVVDVAFSADSRTMYVLRQQLADYSLVKVTIPGFQVDSPTAIEQAGTSLSMSPRGALYVVAQNGIGEYNPQTMEHVATIAVNGLPGELRFTPDGSRAYFANRTPDSTGRSVQSFRTDQRLISAWPQATSGAPRFDDILVASDTNVFALDRNTNTLYRIGGTPLTGSVASFPGVLDSTQVFSAVLSGEVPALSLFTLGNFNGQLALRKIKLEDNTLSGQTGVSGSTGVLSYAAVAPTTGAATMTKFGDQQRLPLTGGTVRLAVRLTDEIGRPTFDHTVIFATGNSNVTLSNGSTRTGSNGMAETYVSVPGQPGTYTIGIVAASISDSFQIIVSEDDNGGGGTGGEPGTGEIRILRGDGALIAENYTNGGDDGLGSPLTVQILDGDGDPRKNANVTFEVISGPVTIGFNRSTMTDADGIARISFSGQPIIGQAWVPAIVRAHSDVGDVDFHITVYDLTQDKIESIQVDNPLVFTVSGARGEVIANAFSARISARSTGEGIPLVGLRTGDPADFRLDGAGSCVNNPVSDTAGVLKCDLKISCSATDQQDLLMVIGENRAVRGSIFATSAGGRKLALVSGNSQSGSGGSSLNRLVAKVTDGCDLPVSGQDVVWTVTQGSATLTQVVSRSGSDGLVSTGVTLGSVAGAVTVRVSLANASPVIFNLTNNIVINSVSLVSGGGQSANIGSAFANPVVFAVRDTNGNPVGAGVAVTFAVDKGASLGTTSATTDAQGRAQTSVTAGSQTGTITVTATAAGKTATAQLTVRPPTLPLDANSFTNTASRVPGLVPCGLGTLAGNGLAPTPGSFVLGVPAFGPWLTEVAGVIIQINGVRAPIQVVANQQGVQTVNFQVPCETQPGLATAVVTVNGTATTVANVSIFAAQPGVFTYTENGKNYGAVIRLKDGTYVTANNPAVTGEQYYLILTGLGQTTPPIATNSVGTGQQVVNAPIIMGVNDVGVPSQPARYLTGSTGVYYVEFTIPRLENVPSGTILRDVNFAAAAVVNGQFIFGNELSGLKLAAVLQQ